MDKIFEKLSGVLTAEDLKEVKDMFEAMVSDKSKAMLTESLDKETQALHKQAEVYCKGKIDEAVAKKTAELEEAANKYCEMEISKVKDECAKKVKDQCKKLEEAADKYILQKFETYCMERVGEELNRIEENATKQLQSWVNGIIAEKISPKLIKQTAITETYEPIIQGIQSLFEDKYVALDLSGSKQIAEAQAESAELRESLAKQTQENIRLIEKMEELSKAKIVAEQTRGLSKSMSERVKEHFSNKSLNETKEDIEDYVGLMVESEQPREVEMFKKPSTRRFASKSLMVEDSTFDAAPKKKFKKSLNMNEKFLLKSAKLV